MGASVGAVFGAGWQVSLPSGIEGTRLRQELEVLLDTIDRDFSPWRKDSTLARFNSGGAGKMVVLREIVTVTSTALQIAGASDGCFDPTVGPLVGRWGFGPIRKSDAPVEGWRRLAAGFGHIAKTEPGITLDLCGIAKGHALDRMVSLLLDAGHESFLIDLGGELAARGRRPSGESWRIGVEDPRLDRDGLAGVLRLDGMAVATSGDRANGYDLDHRRYSHIIDPATREPVTGALASVSVLMESACLADGWATALMAAGDAGPTLADRNGISALFLFRDGANLRRVLTGTFGRHFA